MIQHKPITPIDGPSIRLIESLAKKIWTEHYTPIIGGNQIRYMVDKFQSRESILEQLQEGYLYHLLMEEQGRLIGYLSVLPREDELFLSKFYISLEFRGKGYGREAMGFILDLARNKNLPKITLTVHKRNPSVGIYKKLGFIVTGPVMTDIGEGYVMDDYRMELSL